jgi:hypothetical protein
VRYLMVNSGFFDGKYVDFDGKMGAFDRKNGIFDQKMGVLIRIRRF